MTPQEKISRVFDVMEVYEIPDDVKIKLVEAMVDVFIELLKQKLEIMQLEKMTMTEKKIVI